VPRASATIRHDSARGLCEAARGFRILASTRHGSPTHTDGSTRGRSALRRAARGGVAIQRGPQLHPDDVTRVAGIPVTSPTRTLIDLAEVTSPDELRATFAHARELGLFDPDALRAARGRVEWRPSLAMLDEVIDGFCS
jgi:hypothetical protein